MVTLFESDEFLVQRSDGAEGPHQIKILTKQGARSDIRINMSDIVPTILVDGSCDLRVTARSRIVRKTQQTARIILQR